MTPAAATTATPGRHVLDDLGAEVWVPSDPARLASLVPSLSEVLWWWHLADRLVAVTDHCVAPPGAFGAARRVRGTKNPDVAALIEGRPELVIANEEENRARDVETLREAGIEVYVTRVRTVEDATDSLARLGEALGVPAAGLALGQSIRRALDRVVGRDRQVAAICPIWRDGTHLGVRETWWLVGPDTFAGDLLRHVGFDLAAARVAAELQAGVDGAGADRTTAPGPVRYPRAPLATVQGLASVALLPDEPYAFGPRDASELRERGLRVRPLDGAALTWWGPRTPSAITDLAGMAAQLARPRRRDRVQSP
ncbi:MAG: hypothetical protein JJT89_09030 [Nitriliruptoraceae bacterium]|nr:hypothetical protein [Nitriliruptoraceae bacterium]